MVKVIAKPRLRKPDARIHCSILISWLVHVFLATKPAFDLFHRWSSCHTTTAGTWCPTRGKTPRRLTTATSCRTPTLRCRQRRWRRRQCPWPSTTTATCWPQVRCRTENWTKNLLSSGRCWETRTMEISSLCELCLALIWPAEDFLGCQQQQLLWCAPSEKIFFCSVLKCNFLSHPHRCSLFIFCINSNNNNNSCNHSNNSNNNCFNCSCSNSSRSNVFIAKQSGQTAEFLQSLASPPEFEIRLWTFSPCHCFSRLNEKKNFGEDRIFFRRSFLPPTKKSGKNSREKKSLFERKMKVMSVSIFHRNASHDFYFDHISYLLKKKHAKILTAQVRT